MCTRGVRVLGMIIYAIIRNNLCASIREVFKMIFGKLTKITYKYYSKLPIATQNSFNNSVPLSLFLTLKIIIY